jgi:uncharacterized Zn-binding protein involved in type VI secretion
VRIEQVIRIEKVRNMGEPFIVIGDMNDHEEVVLEGAPVSTPQGKAIARVGDAVREFWLSAAP